MKNMSGEDGWSLVEVLVAFAILTSSIMMGFQIIAGGIHRIASARSESQLLSGANAVLANLAARKDLQVGSLTIEDAEGTSWNILVGAPRKSDEHTGKFLPAQVRIWNGNGSHTAETPLLETVLIIRDSGQ